MSFDKRGFVKMLASTVVTNVVGAIASRVISNALPATQKLKIAEMSGAAIGWIVAGKTQPYIDVQVDHFFDTRVGASAHVEYSD